MEYTGCEPALPLRPSRMVAGEWYLRGFLDTYEARLAVIPLGPAGEEYKKGYAEGLSATQRDFFAAIWTNSVSIPQPLFESADVLV